MATSYPTSVDTTTTLPSPGSTEKMDGTTTGVQFEHDVVHSNLSGAVIALETAVGITGAFKFAPAGTRVPLGGNLAASVNCTTSFVTLLTSANLAAGLWQVTFAAYSTATATDFISFQAISDGTSVFTVVGGNTQGSSGPSSGSTAVLQVSQFVFVINVTTPGALLFQAKQNGGTCTVFGGTSASANETGWSAIPLPAAI